MSLIDEAAPPRNSRAEVASGSGGLDVPKANSGRSALPTAIRRPPQFRQRRQRPEQQIQRAVFEHLRTRDAPRVLRGASLIWRRDGADWVLFSGRRRVGRVVADSKYAGLWRSVLSGGRLSDRANLAWAKNAVLMAAERELEWEDRQRAAIAPPKCSEKRGVFESAASPVARTVEGGAP
jgi:hypothetical protein